MAILNKYLRNCSISTFIYVYYQELDKTPNYQPWALGSNPVYSFEPYKPQRGP